MQEPFKPMSEPFERSPSTRRYGENTQEPSKSSPKSFKWFPLAASKSSPSASETAEPSEVSCGNAINYVENSSPIAGSPLLTAGKVPMPSESSPRKRSPWKSSSRKSSPLKSTKSMETSPRKSMKHSDRSPLWGKPPLSSVETPMPSESTPCKISQEVDTALLTGDKTPKAIEKSPVDLIETPKPSGSSPIVITDPRSGSRIGESRRRTKRMPVDMASAELEASPSHVVSLSSVSQEFLLGEGIPLGAARVHSLEVLQRQQFWTPQKARTGSPDKCNPNSSVKRVDGSGVGSSKRSGSSRSMARSQHFEETEKQISPQLTAVGTPNSSDRMVHLNKVTLPKEEIFPGNTNSLPQIKVRTPRLTEASANRSDNTYELNLNPVSGDSSGVTRRNENRVEARTHVSGSLPTSPRHTSGKTRTARLLRRLKLTGRGSRAGSDDSKLGTNRSSIKAGNTMTGSGSPDSSERHRNFSGSLEPRKLNFAYRNWTDPDLGNTMLRESRGEVVDPAPRFGAERVDRSEASQSSVPGKQQFDLSSETSLKKKSSLPWTFKWKWGSNSRSKTVKGGTKASPAPLPHQRSNQAGDSSPTAAVMGDARNSFTSQSDRFSSRGTAEKLFCDRVPKHRRGLSWGAGSTASLCSGSNPTDGAFTPSQPRLPTRDAQELLLPPRKLLVAPTVNVVNESQEQGPSTELRRSNPGAGVLRASADSDVFEDCFGSFRSVESPTKSCGSFRSIESPGMSSIFLRKSGLSIDEAEWEGHMSSSFRQEITEINDEACTSSSKFSLKCSKVQQFNKFLRTQKERLRRGADAGNSDCFCIVIPGRDLELSSVVAALGYTWLQENSFPKISGDTWHPVPMIDMPRQQMHKHKDAAWLFDACGIDAGALLFADDIELSTLVGAGRIKMSIIGQDVLVTRNEVGSVCTLLMEMLLSGHRGLLQPRYLKAFMLAGILLDTENLDFASMRDTKMSNLLVEWLGCVGRTMFYNQLKDAEDDATISKLISQIYDNQPSARLKLRVEADHEHSDRESIFTQSQDHTSTSEAGTSSSLEEDSPRPKVKQRSSFKYSRLTPQSAPAKSHRLSLPGGCLDQDAQAVAHIRKAAIQSGHPTSALPSYGQYPHRAAKSSAFARIRKKLFLED